MFGCRLGDPRPVPGQLLSISTHNRHCQQLQREGDADPLSAPFIPKNPGQAGEEQNSCSRDVVNAVQGVLHAGTERGLHTNLTSHHHIPSCPLIPSHNPGSRSFSQLWLQWLWKATRWVYPNLSRLTKKRTGAEPFCQICCQRKKALVLSSEGFHLYESPAAPKSCEKNGMRTFWPDSLKTLLPPPEVSPMENAMDRERRISGNRPKLFALSDMKRMKKITQIVYCQTESKHEKKSLQGYTVKKFRFHHKSSLKSKRTTHCQASNSPNNPRASECNIY